MHHAAVGERVEIRRPGRASHRSAAGRIDRAQSRIHHHIAPVSGSSVIRHQLRLQESGYDRARKGGTQSDDLLRLRLRLVAPAVEIEGEAHGIACIPVQQQAACDIGLVPIGVVARNAILPVVRIECRHRYATAQCVGDRAADIGIALDLVEATVADVTARLETAGRLRRDVIDRAAGGILTEQGSLWPFEHFHPFEIVSGMAGQHWEGEWCLVKIDTDSRIDSQ